MSGSLHARKVLKIFTGHRSPPVEYMRGLKYLSKPNSFPPVLVLDPRSVFHMTYSLLSPPSSCRISRSPSRTLRCSSRARQPKYMVLFNQTVRRRASGEWSPSCFSLQNFSRSSFVKPSALFRRVPLPDSLSCFRFDSNASRELSKLLS
mgnify:CR=1 FL=1